VERVTSATGDLALGTGEAEGRARRWVRWLELLEEWGYLTAGLSFLLAGMVTFVYAWFAFFAALGSGVLHAVLLLTNDLLFVLILLELFRTVINFLKSRIVTLEPFLYVGIIAGTRRILTSGTQLVHFEQMERELFDRYLWDVGANLIVVFVLVLGLVLLGRYGTRLDREPARL
jgi:uncharacterized membrane protein (DUF373 family)